MQLKKETFSWIKTIIVAVLVALFINNFIIVNAKIPTGSMENTIMTGDRVLAFRLAYIADSPKRGDIVVFKYPDDESQLFVKRIVGLPGEKIEIIEGKIYINDSKTPLEDEYVKQNPINGEDNLSYGPFEIPENAYFMMGDNRTRSHDSREWQNKFVYKDKIIGKAFFRYFPNPSML